MSTHINMELFSHLDIEIPDPTKADLKWKEQIDKKCTNLSAWNTRMFMKEFGKAIVSEGQS